MASNGLPDRYRIEYRAFEGGENKKAIHRRDLLENGNRAFIQRGFQKPLSELEKPEHPDDHVYLDGAAEGPFYDPMRGIFSLDHHSKCVRQITDATCIQGINLARTRIITALGNTIVGNDPDLDTVFATWALLNADLVAHDDRVFRRVLPLFIVEGNIDALGLGYTELTGLSQEVVVDMRQKILWLLKEERDLKARDKWGTTDFADFTEYALRKLDRHALFRDNLDVPVHMDVHEKIPLKHDKTLHYVQAPDTGIYEVEHTILHHLDDKECACIVFHDGKSKWTIKLTGFVNDMKLGKVAVPLNEAELKIKIAKGVEDKKMLEAKWGGGDSIQGAPRYPNGVGPFLPNDQILEIVKQALLEQMA